MRTMFQMGFTPQLFGQRMGAVRLRSLGDTTVSRDALLGELKGAQIKLYMVDEFVSKNPDLAQKLGADYSTFQSWQFAVQGSKAAAEDILGKLDSAAKGSQATLTADEESAVRSYKSGATILSDIVAKYSPEVKPPAPPAGSPAAAKLPVNDLGPALMVGGGVLAIGVIAILLKA